METADALIVKENTVLVVLAPSVPPALTDFCGSVIRAHEVASLKPTFVGKTVFLCGDIQRITEVEPWVSCARRILVISDVSHGRLHDGRWPVVGLGRVPRLVHGVGVFYPQFFDPQTDYFNHIRSEHTFQSLTESTKGSKAHRTGIYLTPVEREGEDLHFRLLRCSTNLSGPTENFRATDRHIVDALNQEAACIFRDYAPLNHVLAQIYHNTPATSEHKQIKAKIKSHADKTKDMPHNGIMAFCTFYDQIDNLQPMADDAYDLGYKRASGLTRLVFRLKPTLASSPDHTLPNQFAVTLYPNSVFFMPLATNRWFTHEIQAPGLDAARLPTRMGYVVRCSATEAVNKGGITFLKTADGLRELEPPTPEGMGELRQLYAQENRTDAMVDYRDRFFFSMNKGDYEVPDYKMSDEFRRYPLATQGNLFELLRASVRFQDVGKGRQGTALVDADPQRGIPIVRTTTKYVVPSQRFQTLHRRLAIQIRERASLPFALNNALIERYTQAYATMGFHSDQALDLQDGSFIALFSCYKHPEVGDAPRLLVVESKAPGGGTFEVPLAHNSVIVFSLDTNRRFKHKIVLDKSAAPGNEWLGITLRTSKTFVQFRDEQAYLEDGTPAPPGK